MRLDTVVILAVMQGGRPTRSTCLEVDPEIWSVLEQRCWSSNPASRPSMHALSLVFDIICALKKESKSLSDADTLKLIDIADGKGGDMELPPTRRNTHGNLKRVLSLSSKSNIIDAFKGRKRRRSSTLPNEAAVKSKLKDPPYACHWPGCPS